MKKIETELLTIRLINRKITLTLRKLYLLSLMNVNHAYTAVYHISALKIFINLLKISKFPTIQKVKSAVDVGEIWNFFKKNQANT